MSDKDCPDKLEPKVGNHTGSNPQYLTSVQECTCRIDVASA